MPFTSLTLTRPPSPSHPTCLQQDAIFERASRELDLDAVVVLNADIMLGDDFVDALEHAEATFERFLLVGARYDNLRREEVLPDAGPAWVDGFRERTLRDGALHTYGGSDYFAWRPVGDPALAAVGGRIPPFTYGRGKADNWIIEMAVRNGVVEVIDASTAVVALHPAHGYANVAAGPGAGAPAPAPGPPPPPPSLPNPGTDANAAGAGLVAEARDRGLKGERAAAGAYYDQKPHQQPQHRSLAQEDAPEHGSEDQDQDPDEAEGSGDPAASGKYVNFWSAKSGGDPQADMNKHLAYTFGRYENGEGTPLHAPWQLMRCVEAAASPAASGGFGYVEKPCLRYRVRPGACPCEHASAVPRTLSEVEVDGRGQRLCGRAPVARSESFEADFALRQLVAQQAVDGTVVLIGFNYGYQDMLMNMVCRLGQLGVPNYVIAAFDADAFAFCRRQVLPCFPVSPEVAARAEQLVKAGADGKDEAADAPADPAGGAGAGGGEPRKHGAPGGSGSAASEAQAFGTQGFRALTKLKSQQVLRILEAGYNVMWSDVDIFWNVNPIPGVLAEMRADGGDADIGIQSNAPPAEAAENGHRRINSGFYFAKSNAAAVDAFRQIVAHARQSKLSEQPSFYTVLCGDEKQYVRGSRACANTAIPVATRFLSREVYPNGAMVDVVRGVTPAAPRGVAIVHFNWLEGHDAKVQSFVDASMWMLDPRTGACIWDSPTRGADPALVAAAKAGAARKAEQEEKARKKAEEAAKRAAEEEARRKAKEDEVKRLKEEQERQKAEAAAAAEVAKGLVASGAKGRELVEKAKALGGQAKGSALLGEVLAAQASDEALASLAWLAGAQYGPALKALLAGDAADQKEAVYAVQRVCEARGYPKVGDDPLIEKLFHGLYGADILDEPAFTGWRDDEREEGNKRKAVVQTTPWFTWLETADEDDEDGSDDGSIEQLENF